MSSNPFVPTPAPSAVTLLPIMGVVFVAYLIIGLAMPVLPLHVHEGLGLGAFAVGLVAGSQFAAALLSRMWAGHFTDRNGAKRAVVAGLLGASLSGVFYLLSLRFVADPRTSVAVLLLGRVLLGAGESFVITGSLSWGLSLMGSQNTGKVMSWIGTSLYAAYAVGAPAGAGLYAEHGFAAVSLAALGIPLGSLALAVRLHPVAPVAPAGRPAFAQVASSVWIPGLSLALSGVGFAAITTFIALLYSARGWSPAWLAFSLLSVAFIVGRLCFGHLPDRIGGAKVALVCIAIEAAGQALIWLAPTGTVALMGVTLSGLGYSLVYPGLGVEALRRVPPESRALAMGTYTAWLDLSLGLSSPALGLVAGAAGIGAVFLASTLAIACAGVITLSLFRRGRKRETRRSRLPTGRALLL